MDQTTEDLQPAIDGSKPLISPLTGPEPYDRTGELMKELPKYVQKYQIPTYSHLPPYKQKY